MHSLSFDRETRRTPAPLDLRPLPLQVSAEGSPAAPSATCRCPSRSVEAGKGPFLGTGCRGCELDVRLRAQQLPVMTGESSAHKSICSEEPGAVFLPSPLLPTPEMAAFWVLLQVRASGGVLITWLSCAVCNCPGAGPVLGSRALPLPCAGCTGPAPAPLAV